MKITKMFEFYYVPIGICRDIEHHLSLLADIDAVYFQRTDSYKRALINEIGDEVDTVHMLVNTSIEDSLVDGFEEFLLKYIADMRNQIKTLNRIYSEVQSDNS